MADSKLPALRGASVVQVLSKLKAGKVRELDDVTDLCGDMMAAIISREIPTSMAKELRQWAELMYSSVQAQRSDGDGDINFVTQLIQMNGGATALEENPKQKVKEILDVDSLFQ